MIFELQRDLFWWSAVHGGDLTTLTADDYVLEHPDTCVDAMRMLNTAPWLQTINCTRDDYIRFLKAHKQYKLSVLHLTSRLQRKAVLTVQQHITPQVVSTQLSSYENNKTILTVDECLVYPPKLDNIIRWRCTDEPVPAAIPILGSCPTDAPVNYGDIPGVYYNTKHLEWYCVYYKANLSIYCVYSSYSECTQVFPAVFVPSWMRTYLGGR